jgi:MFS family permease
MYMRSVVHRGYVLTSGLYFVVTAHLSASQLVLLGTIMSLTLVVCDIPAGVWADTIGRRWSLVMGQLVLGAGMVLTGLVTTFPLLVVTQLLWGLGWAFLNGADSAWLNDELNDPHRIARVLTASARWDRAGGASGMIVLGLLAWATSLATAIVVSGVAMALLALFVTVRFTERHFTPTRQKRCAASRAVFQRGMSLSRRDHEILLVFLATVLFNAAAMVSWLYPKQLITPGLPRAPVLWYALLGIGSSASGFVALRVVEGRIDGLGSARRFYALACFSGALGLLVLAVAPVALIGGVGVLCMTGLADSVTRSIGVVWVNRRTRSDVRATVHSFLSQAESIGEISGGVALAAVAQATSTALTLTLASALIATTGVMVARSRADRHAVGWSGWT